MDVEHFLKSPNENYAVMESPMNEELIESVLNPENDHELDDSSTIRNVSSNEAFQAVSIIKKDLLQYKQNVPEIIQYMYYKKLRMMPFSFGGRKKQST